MIREAIATGVSVEAAIEAAVAKLGVDRETVEVQIISLPRKGFLGLFGGNPAKVRAYYDMPDVVEKPVSKPVTKPVSKPETKPAPQGQKPQEAKSTKPQTPKPAPQPKPVEQKPAQTKEETPKPQRSEKPVRTEKPAIDLNNEGVPVEEGSKGAVARDFLLSVIRAMDIDDITVEASMQGETAVLRLVGESNGLIIGKRGETLDALQYLSSLASNRVEGDYIRVVIDSGNYRERRQQTLEKLAQKISASVLKTGRSVTLEPMNPYERRIIHSTVSEVEGVKSISVGEEPNRKVVITLVSGGQPSNNSRRRFQGNDNRRNNNNNKKPYNRNNTPRDGVTVTTEGEQKPRQNRDGGSNRKFSGSNNRGGYNKKPRTQNTAPVPQDNPNREKPTEAANAPVYGKIEL